MRSLTLSSALVLAMLLALSTLTCAQLVDSVSQPFERSLDETTLLTEQSLLAARQASNSTSTASAAEPSGSAAPGGDATITDSACSMTNHLSINQQASWGNGFINTCCGFDAGTQCWYRHQNSVAPELECEIPSCADLETEDKSKMVGFVPLNSTNGSGKYGNIFLSLGQISAAMGVAPMLGLTLVVAVAVSVMGCL